MVRLALSAYPILATHCFSRTLSFSSNTQHAQPLSYKTNNKSPVFAGKDASRGLGMSSLKPEDARPDWEDLSDEHKKVLDDWYTFFSKRYNIKGKVSNGGGASL